VVAGVGLWRFSVPGQQARRRRGAGRPAPSV